VSFAEDPEKWLPNKEGGRKLKNRKNGAGPNPTTDDSGQIYKGKPRAPSYLENQIRYYVQDSNFYVRKPDYMALLVLMMEACPLQLNKDLELWRGIPKRGNSFTKAAAATGNRIYSTTLTSKEAQDYAICDRMAVDDDTGILEPAKATDPTMLKFTIPAGVRFLGLPVFLWKERLPDQASIIGQEDEFLLGANLLYATDGNPKTLELQHDSTSCNTKGKFKVKQHQLKVKGIDTANHKRFLNRNLGFKHDEL
jgi:hypothetical protein